MPYYLHNLGFSYCIFGCKMMDDKYMNGRQRENFGAMREHKMLERRLTCLTKMKGTRDEPGQRLVDRLTNSNNKQVIFYITRKADNFYVA